MKILVIRLSSIGDIVLTSPVVRCLKQQLAGAELHFLCKEPMLPVVEKNPYLSRIHLFRPEEKTLVNELRAEQFDCVIDLQKSRLSRRLVHSLGKDYHSFPKLNFRKMLLVLFKLDLLPRKHVVDRYFEAVRFLSVKNDGKGLDFFLSDEDYKALEQLNLPPHYVAVAVGSQHATKQIPVDKIQEIMRMTAHPMVFLGDSRDALLVKKLCQRHPEAVNLCGKLPLSLSAACLSRAETVLTGDTGLMHIACAFHKRVVSLWGNTVPAFGMYPYQPGHEENVHIVENRNLWCRPCSKLGYNRCPLGHFRCMRRLSASDTAALLNEDMMF